MSSLEVHSRVEGHDQSWMTAIWVAMAVFLLVLQLAPAPPTRYLMRTQVGGTAKLEWQSTPPDPWQIEKSVRTQQLVAIGPWWWQAEAARHYQRLERETPATDVIARNRDSQSSPIQLVAQRTERSIESAWSASHRLARESLQKALADARQNTPRFSLIGTRPGSPNRAWLAAAALLGTLCGIAAAAPSQRLRRQLWQSPGQPPTSDGSAADRALPTPNDESTVDSMLVVLIPADWLVRRRRWSVGQVMTASSAAVIIGTILSIAWKCGFSAAAWQAAAASPLSAVASLWG
jgi:hypothetical protein